MAISQKTKQKLLGNREYKTTYSTPLFWKPSAVIPISTGQKAVSEAPLESAVDVSQKSNPNKKINDFIRENWLSMSDEIMAKKLGLTYSSVCNYRWNLGLKRRDPIDISYMGTEAEVRKALTNGGKMVADIIREKCLKVSREDMTRRLFHKYGLTDLHKLRTTLWYATRIGYPELADKKTFETWLKESGNMTVLAKDLNVKLKVLRSLKSKVGIPMRKNVMGKNNRVSLVCAYPGCKKTFKRFKLGIDKEKKRNPSIEFCCSREHHFKLFWIKKKQKEAQSRQT